MSKKNPKEYLEMWLSEQIPLNEWIKILDRNPKIEQCYKKYITERDKLMKDDIITLDDLEPKKKEKEHA